MRHLDPQGPKLLLVADTGPRADATPQAATPATSPLAEALATVGDRWTLLVVATLLDGPRRFGDLGRELSGIAPNILSARLRRLEQAGLVVAEPYQERPPRFVYELTAPGRELAGALRLLAGWGGRHREEAESPRHGVCGSPLEARWWCPTCEEALETAGDDDELHFA